LQSRSSENNAVFTSVMSPEMVKWQSCWRRVPVFTSNGTI